MCNIALECEFCNNPCDYYSAFSFSHTRYTDGFLKGANLNYHAVIENSKIYIRSLTEKNNHKSSFLS